MSTVLNTKQEERIQAIVKSGAYASTESALDAALLQLKSHNSVAEKRYLKHLSWERESNQHLYYPFWILFAGGFLYSFHVQTPPPNCLMSWGIIALRLLAVAGSIVNFLMQYQANESLGQTHQVLLKRDRGQPDYKVHKILAARSDSRVRCLEPSLHVLAVAFLLLALCLSFGAYPPW